MWIDDSSSSPAPLPSMPRPILPPETRQAMRAYVVDVLPHWCQRHGRHDVRDFAIDSCDAQSR